MSTTIDAQTSPQRVADSVRERMFARDRASQSLGMEVIQVARSAAKLTMRVRARMVNGFGVCRGGLITTLADSAFAIACNAGNEFTVAAGLSIDFLAPAHEGDLLTATAAGVAQSARSSVYDVSVTNQRGERVAVLRARSHRVKGKPSIRAAT